MYPFKFEPIYDKTIWANDHLTQIRNIKEKGYGTSWEISAHPYSKNRIINGKFKGKTLDELLNEHESEIIGNHSRDQMLRLAYLDAKEDLSIQVHPFSSYAIAQEHDLGKTEAWYILEAKENASLVAGTLTNDATVIKQAIENNTLEKYLRKIPIEKGDFIHIDAGMLHALGGGILAIEVGTNSNVTYRFYDYGRKDQEGNSRPLHLEKSFDVVDFNKRREKVSSPFADHKCTQSKVLTDVEEFVIELYDVVDEITFDTEKKDFHCLTFVSSDAKIAYGNEMIPVSYTESVFIPAACGKYTIQGSGRVLKSYLR